MDATTDKSANIPGTPRTAEASWQHAKDLWSSNTSSEARTAFKNLIGTLPGWTIALGIVAFFGIASHSVFVMIPLAAAGFLVATHFTVKRAILSAFRERETQQRY